MEKRGKNNKIFEEEKKIQIRSFLDFQILARDSGDKTTTENTIFFVFFF